MQFGAAALLAWVLPGFAARAATNDAEEVVKKFAGGKTPMEGRIQLDLPEVADDGNSVPMTITVDSPMTEQSHVTTILVVATANPRSGVATFHLSPATGVADVSTRIRLAETQDVIAVAKMNDGTCYLAKRLVKVTVGGCGA